MQKFNDKKGKRRLLEIVSMKATEVADYYIQFKGMDNKKMEQAITWLKSEIENHTGWKEVDQWILAIKSRTRKLVGVIKVWEMEPDQAFVKIHIPNENWVLKYGTEAVDQFVKICREMQYFSTIEFERDNEIIERYRVQHGMETYKIELKEETE